MEIEKTMLDQTIDIVVQAATAALNIFKDLLVAMDAADFWISAVLLVLVFSILILPLRGGQAIHFGGFAGMIANKVNPHRGKKNSKGSSNSGTGN